MKKLTLVVAVTAALIGSVTSARAESGTLIGGGRLALNYSNLVYDGYYDANDGGIGIEAGVLGRYVVVDNLVGVHAGFNVIYREPYYWDRNNRAHETAVSVPLLFEINPFVSSGLSSSYYEMIFVQVGLQADYVFDFTMKDNIFKGTSSEENWDRNNVNIGVVLGAVGYFNSNCSLDIRAVYGVTRFADISDYNGKPKKIDQNLYSVTIGVSVYL